LLLDIGALEQSADYLDFVRHSNPGFDLNFKLPDPAIPDKRKQIPSAMLQILSRNHAIYSLTPAPQADSIAEFFDFQLHGLIYVLRRYETDEAFARPIPAEFARDNETFWRTFETRQLPELDRQINPLQPLPGRSIWESLWNTLQFWPEPDHESVIAGGFYAEALNDWGVSLQRTGKFAEAKHCFDEALELNAHSAAAQINRKFNADYLANRQETMKRPPETAASMNEYRDWRHVLRDGAVDEPNFCYMLGAILADNQLYRPAIAQIQRVTELAPAREDPYVTLAQLFGTFHDFPNVLRTTDKLLAISPTNDTAVLLKANALFELKDYPNSISFADRHLATVPADTAALLLKAAAYGQLLEYSKAISVLDQVLALNPTNAAALLGQGEALRRSGEYAAARRDFNMLVQTVTNSYPAYFNLAAMADAENDRPAAITNYEMFLKLAPPNTPEIADAEARLKALRPDRP
jgi:tetratricopeptide (TPR) repeat protein